jgi:2-succinyl-5-enolpyruvyl-6-hydroxy-3-cyclohexene-1-carboxylate synthase
VRRVAVSPGSRSTPLALALHRQPTIEVSVILDERSAGFFALGAAQAEGRPAVVACTSGSAAANLHPAVVEADEAGVPLIVLTADRPPELRGIGAGQTIDQLKLYGSAVRWFCEVGTHEADDAGLLHFRSVACRAYAAARGERRPGPVHLNVPFRDPLGPEAVEGDVTAASQLALRGRGERPLTAVATTPSSPDEALLDELAERLAGAPRGVIVAGRQTDPALAGPVAELARAAGYPILAEPTSQLRCGHHDLSGVVGVYDAIARARPQNLAPELVLRFGDMVTSKALRQWMAELDGTRQVVVDPAGGWNEPSQRAETIVRADPVDVATGLASRLDRGPGDWLGSWRDAAGSIEAAVGGELGKLGEPSEPGVHAALAGVYPEGALVYTASSMPIRDQEAFLPATPRDLRFLCNRGANGIDGLLSSAAGAAAASGRPTYAVIGDLGLTYDMAGLAAARHAPGPFRVVVLNNGGGGIFHFLPQADQLDPAEFETLLATPQGLDVARIAALFDFDHRRIDSLDQLSPVLDGDRVIAEVPIDRATNLELHQKLSSLSLRVQAT